MIIPENFKDTVICYFGDKGREWLVTLPQLLEKCENRWSLSNCRPCPDLSINYIFFAESPIYGQVAIKVGVPNPDMFTEMKALSLYDGRNICKCYEFDAELGAMVLEKVMPGGQLKALTDSNERISIGSEVISKLPIPIENSEELPAYSQWVEKAFKRAREENKVGEKMLSYIDEAEVLFKEIQVTDRRKVLLHGDLHHENILRDEKNEWKVIDPKGIIGPLSMEAARFIENEFTFVAPEERIVTLDKMCTIFSEKLNTSKRIIAACSFVLVVLSICWGFEDYYQDPWVYEQIEDCKIYLDYVKELK